MPWVRVRACVSACVVNNCKELSWHWLPCTYRSSKKVILAWTPVLSPLMIAFWSGREKNLLMPRHSREVFGRERKKKLGSVLLILGGSGSSSVRWKLKNVRHAILGESFVTRLPSMNPTLRTLKKLSFVVYIFSLRLQFLIFFSR